MKKVTTIWVMLLALFLSMQTFAQKSYKFGHIDSNALLGMMPERAAAKDELDKHAKQLESTLSQMQQEFQAKYQEYVEKADSMSTLIRQTKEQELSEMQQRIQTFQQTAQKDLSQKENELLQPIIEKAKKAIDEVATEGGYLYVFDSSTGVLLHIGADSEDLMPKVKAKLGIQ